MKRFEHYFNDDAIIDELCKFRAREAKRRNDALFLHRISSTSKKKSDQPALDIFPPRKAWHRNRSRVRNGKPSLQLNREALKRTILRLRHAHPLPIWAEKLQKKIEEIRSRALAHTGFVFSEPTIVPQEKDKAKAEYRAIANFTIEDKIIDCLTARYLREILDPALSDSCLAFRCGKPGKPAPQFHDALKKILAIRRRHHNKPLFVAECDIMGFFDCVDHSVATQALRETLRDAHRQTNTLQVDQRALNIFQAYLDCYSFPANVRLGREPKLRKDLGNPAAKFKWPDHALLEFHEDPESQRIGVPQGGALSCLIANCVLHSADKSLRRLRRSTKPRFTYLRYCDDMIILAPSKGSCATAYAAYQKALKTSKLPAHPPKPVTDYSDSFWAGKSNDTYLWQRKELGGIPWIQFVGYQVRYDGLVRIRSKSLKKHFRKLTQETNALLSLIKSTSVRTPSFSHLRKRPAQILHRFRQKLISLSVGRRELNQSLDAPLPMCWVSGFKALNEKTFIDTMLKNFDRHRERQIGRIKRQLAHLPKQRKPPTVTGVTPPDFYGYPFSYAAQLKRKRTRK